MFFGDAFHASIVNFFWRDFFCATSFGIISFGHDFIGLRTRRRMPIFFIYEIIRKNHAKKKEEKFSFPQMRLSLNF